MMTFLSFHAAAVARGDGLRPEFLARLAAADAAIHPAPSVKQDYAPAPTDITVAPTNVVPFPRPFIHRADPGETTS